MSSDLTPQQDAALDRWLKPTKPTIDSDEQQRLYQASIRGHDLPIGMGRWKRLGGKRRFQCPSCYHVQRCAEYGPTACDGCGIVALVTV